MALILDHLINEASSQSSPNKKYEVRLRKDDEGHTWLSCQCKSWTTGPYQKGRPIYSRTCKHTDRTILEKSRELARLGYVPFITAITADFHLEDVIAITKHKKFEPVKSGLSRKVRGK